MITTRLSWLTRAALIALLAVGAHTAESAEPTAAAAVELGSASTVGAEPSPPGKAALDLRAIEILKAMSAKLAAAKDMSFTATAIYESPSRFGPPLVYTTLSQVTMRRPDKLRVITPYDGPASEFYYDGKVMMAYQPAANLVAVAQAPPTIDAMLKTAYESAAIYFPFVTALVADPYADLAPRLQRAFYVGQSRVVGGTTTDMIGIVADDLFGQLWIGADDKLPRAFRATYLDDPSRLRNEVVFSKWELDDDPDDDEFTSASARNAQRISFARPDPSPPGATGSAGANPEAAKRTPEAPGRESQP